MTKMTTIDYMDKALKYGISKLPQEKIWQSSADRVLIKLNLTFNPWTADNIQNYINDTVPNKSAVCYWLVQIISIYLLRQLQFLC